MKRIRVEPGFQYALIRTDVRRAESSERWYTLVYIIVHASGRTKSRKNKWELSSWFTLAVYDNKPEGERTFHDKNNGVIFVPRFDLLCYGIPCS